MEDVPVGVAGVTGVRGRCGLEEADDTFDTSEGARDVHASAFSTKRYKLARSCSDMAMNTSGT